MDHHEFKDFGELFRTLILPELIKHIDPALDHLRRKQPDEWLRIAMELQKRGSYDRIEQQREQEDVIRSLLDILAKGLQDSVPEFVQQHTLALERHFYQHGQELDDLLRKSPNAKPMSAQESVDAQLRAMGFGVNPNDKR